MTKNQFKKAYSLYRGKLSHSHVQGNTMEAIDSNPLLRDIKLSRLERPVSILIYLHLKTR